jgi:hypothetical protein
VKEDIEEFKKGLLEKNRKEVIMMPRGNGAGPMGMGSMTGRGAGFCAGSAVPGYMNAGVGYEMGFGRGRGLRSTFNFAGRSGWGRFGNPVYGGVNAPAADEKELLGNQAELLEKQLEQVKKRLNALNGETE